MVLQFVDTLCQLFEGFEVGYLAADVKMQANIAHSRQFLGTMYGG